MEGHIRAMVEYWLGHVEFSDAVRQGALTVQGPTPLVRELPRWFKRSRFASVPSPAAVE